MSIRRFEAFLVAALVSLAPVTGQESNEGIRISNWPAPAFWSPPVKAVEKEAGALAPEAADVIPTPPMPFIGITPCRVADTRSGQGFSGQAGPPALTSNTTRTFQIAGVVAGVPTQCGIPGAAQAVSFQFTIVTPTAAGNLVAWPEGPQPTTSVLNWSQGTIALGNGIVVPLSGSGGLNVFVNAAFGETAHLTIDVNGYYSPLGIVNTVNGLSGAVTLAGTTDITITPGGNTLTIGTTATSSNLANTIVKRNVDGDIFVGDVFPRQITLQGFGADGGIFQTGNRLLHTGSESSNVFLGTFAGNFTMTGTENTGIGANALEDLTDGITNTAVGQRALSNVTGGDENTAVGKSALLANVTGLRNTAVGAFALSANTGSDNIGIGRAAGNQLSSGSNNIYIGNTGEASESNTIRIGNGLHDRVLLEGVFGTVVASGIPVLANSSGLLGTTTSSASVKREIEDVGDTSAPLSKLRPVSFLYRNDVEGIRQYGLIAEEVAKVMPELVLFSPTGEPQTVRYHFLAPLLLNELQKEQRLNASQRDEIADLRDRLRRLEERLESKGATPR